MFNLLESRKNSLEDLIDKWNSERLNNGEMGICIEVNKAGLDVALDDGDFSEFMATNGAKLIGNNEYNYYYKIENRIMIIPISHISEDECDIYLNYNNVDISKNIEMFDLCNVDVDIEENFFNIVDEAIEESEFKDLEDILSSLPSKDDERDAFNPFTFMICDAIESCVYNELINIITYHLNENFEKENFESGLIKLIENYEEEIDAMHGHELEYSQSNVHYVESDSCIDIGLYKIAGVYKKLSIDTNIFFSRKELYGKFKEKMNNLVKEIIQESPYELRTKLLIKE